MKKQLRKQVRALIEKLSEEEKQFNTTAIKNIVGNLYEKLAVLEYMEHQIDSDTAETAFDSKTFREQNWFKEPEPVPQPEHEEDLVEPLMEKIKDIVAQMPKEADRVDQLLEDILPKKNLQKNDKNELEDFAEQYQQMPTFERKTVGDRQNTETENHTSKNGTSKVAELANRKEPKKKSVNEAVNTGLQIGLNDRLAFIKHLFDGNANDYTRVLSQINTMKSYDEAESFIKGKIKPDYNYWLNKDEYADRFMAVIEKNFK
ncbi:hypothetical protein [Marixanthomonas spongiae]|uniref:Uncharacterized protein n=1 Tax=Marixanthomonas spongiae TaxID=2174845 RepID=A0A2U0I290_9FLAO|nr:hypothetical protein [Marixanthomonas spongiae]PVW15215.1 hypothetical protein DDV96_07360 [Marixanthomonas spongiae]